MAFIADQRCFACGHDNPIGLKLIFREERDTYVTLFTADRVYQGYEGIVHGGILATVLDESMARYIWTKFGPAATAKLAVTYRRPAPTGTPIEIRGWITAARRNGRAFEMAAIAQLFDGTVLAEATGLILRTGEGTEGSPCKQQPS